MVETVESGLLQVPDESAQRHDVLVVSVPAWPHGPVAALRGERQDVGGKGPAYFFPVRCGEHTRCLTFEEIMRLTEGLRRSIRLRLLELKNQQQGFYFASRASICLQNVLDVPLPVNGGDQGFHGTITSVDVDAITLEVAGARVSGRWQDGSGVSHLLEATVPDGKRLVVPLEFVRAAWRDPEPAAWVGLALDVDVVWRGNRWNLDLGGGAR